jgi:hypothetical protein
MTALDELDATARPRLWRAAKFLLFLLTEGTAVVLIGFAALFLNFHPAWSANLPPAGVTRPGDAKSGALMLKGEDGYTEAIRLGAIGFDAVKLIALARLERRPPRLDLSAYPHLPRPAVRATMAADYTVLVPEVTA